LQKITKAFLDALYTFLDGLVHLASDDSPAVKKKGKEREDTVVVVNSTTSSGTASNPLELLDLTDGVSRNNRFIQEQD
jgi:exocyst complex component 2